MLQRHADRSLWWLLGAAAAAGGLLIWRRQDVAALASGAAFFVRDTVLKGRGQQLTYSTTDETGTVLEEPGQLAAAAAAVAGRSVTVDTYTVARMIRSEGAELGNARAHVLLNDAAALGWDLTRTATHSKTVARRGTYGRQGTRRYSTAADPFEGDLAVAELAIAEYWDGVDPTDGAVKFVDRGAMGGVQQGTGSYAALVEAWGAEGLHPFNVPGLPASFVVFKRRASSAVLLAAA